ncbi:MAG: Gfo/Idh/MocA family oxidoreductase, partial [Dysgonamonadaceae bacterium]|nr:Gfo/Idh/MocA family oxidoreductase [Dysgonamonadaceae bacterium]
METRRNFIKKSALSAAGLAMGSTINMSARSYANIMGANDRVRVGILGFSNRFRSSLGKAFLKYAKEMNFEFFTVCDIWNRRRDEGQAWYKEQTGGSLITARNTDELWTQKPDAVIISTADFQHALHTAEAVRAGCDVYVEKPFAETMDDANFTLKAAREMNKVIQVGSQRRSGSNYHAAYDYIKSGKFGKIINVEMT